MPDEFVTKLELEKVITNLEKKMDNGFAELKAQIAELSHKIESGHHQDKEQYDDRYLMRDDSLSDAIGRLNNPIFRQACYPIVAEWHDTEDGKIKMDNIIDRRLECKRDNATKWLSFLKLIAGLLIASGLMYSGISVNKTNQETQKAMIEFIQKGE